MKPTPEDLSEGYKLNSQRLLEMIAMRDDTAQMIKNVPPARRKQALEALDQINRQIEKMEQVLATQYEAHQLRKQLEQMVGEVEARMTIATERIYIAAKHRNPAYFAELEKTLHETMTPEEIEAFYDRIAVREASELDEILARTDDDSKTNSE